MGSVLIVEDDDDIRDDVAEALEEEGYQVAVARNGLEALQVLERLDKPCVILLDLMMPCMDGWQFRDAQLKHGELAKVPVIILSGAGNLAAQLTKLSASGVIGKPFQLEQLIASVARHCRPRGRVEAFA